MAKTISAYWALWTLVRGGGWVVLTPRELQIADESIPLDTVRQVGVHNKGNHLAIDLHIGMMGGGC